jgi:hypothetical protein
VHIKAYVYFDTLHSLSYEGYGVHTSWIFSQYPASPPSIPPCKGGKNGEEYGLAPSPSFFRAATPSIRGGLGWGNAECSNLDSSVISDLSERGS